MKFDNQLRYAAQILDTYKGEMPLHAWLKDYFRDNKQMGSRDRRLLSTLVYSFYRLGHAARDLPVKDRLLTAFFLCTDQPSEWLAHFDAMLNAQIGLPVEDKLATMRIDPVAIFPWRSELSENIDHAAFCRSFLRQPDLFLRIRPGYEAVVREKLGAIAEFLPPAAVRLPNGFKVEQHLTPDQEVVVQDYSSQRVAEFLRSPDAPRSFWDACAASGGKSILAHDLYPDMEITASDIRESILHNLHARFRTAGIKKYHAFIADLTRNAPGALPIAHLVLADVPCTGSGTWGRTPEELFFFDPRAIGRYQINQRKIVANIAARLAPGATLVYCTCSVFKKENEEMVAFLRDDLRLRSQHWENLPGYACRADSLFAARFVKD
jgi:16S rRNA (cytosine967-C5)-methyltransferase